MRLKNNSILVQYEYFFHSQNLLVPGLELECQKHEISFKSEEISLSRATRCLDTPNQQEIDRF